jgi:MoxR-like ATPase
MLGRAHVATEDIRAVAKPVLRHRLILNFNADAEGLTPDRLVDRLLESTPEKAGPVVEDPQAKLMLRT